MSEVVLLFDDENDLVDDRLVRNELEDRVAVPCELYVRVADDPPAILRVEVPHDGRTHDAAHGRPAQHREVAVQLRLRMPHRIGRFDRGDARKVEFGAERHVRTEIVVVERVGLKPHGVSLRIDEHGKVRVGHELMGAKWQAAQSGRLTKAASPFSRRETPKVKCSIRRRPGFLCLSAGKTGRRRKLRQDLEFSASRCFQNATNAARSFDAGSERFRIPQKHPPTINRLP